MLCYVMLFYVVAHLHSVASRHCQLSSAKACSVLKWITQSYLPPTRFDRATPGNLHPPLSTARSHPLFTSCFTFH